MSCFQSKGPLKKNSAVLVKADFQNELFHGHIAHAYSLENWMRFGKIWQVNRDNQVLISELKCLQMRYQREKENNANH